MPEKFSREFFRQAGAKGGKIGGKARAKKLSPERRSEIARNASKVSKRNRKSRQNP